MTLPSNIKYAIYPGSVTLYNGAVAEFTAEELAEAYGVEDEDYLVVANNTQIPAGESYLEYIHLKPRADNVYRNIKVTAQDDDQLITLERDFDGNRTYIQETDPKLIDKDEDREYN